MPKKIKNLLLLEIILLFLNSARMAELVDAQDLKSCGRNSREGSSPSLSTETLVIQ